MLKIIKISFSLFLIYIYIYAPPFKIIPFGLDKIIMLYAIIYITFQKKWSNLIFIFKKEFFLLLLLLLFSFFRSLASEDYTYLMNDFLLFSEVIVCSYFLYLLINSKYQLKLDIILITCSLIASVISLYLILNPSVAFHLKTDVLKFPEHLIDRFQFRGYGLSDGLLFSYPVVLGFISGFIIMGLRSNKIMIIFLPLLLIAIFANARSGLVPILVSIILSLLFNFRHFVKNTGVLILVLVLFGGAITYYINNNEMLQASLEWGFSSFDILGSFLKGEDAENLDVLFTDMQVFPKDIIGWIFGTGKFIFTNNIETTDIGYLLRLNFGGILYSFILLILITYMFIRLFKVNKYIAYLLFISLIYLHFKSDFFIVNTGSRFFFFVYCICILNPSYFKSVKLKYQ